MKSITMLMLALCLSFFSCTYATRAANSAFKLIIQNSSSQGANFVADWVLISYQLGSIVGALMIWPLSMFLGRKAVMMGGIGAAMVGTIIASTIDRVYPLFVAYGLTGLSVAITLIIGNLWLVENAPARSRAQRVMLFNVFGAAGLALSEWINFAIAFSSADTRIAPGLQFLWQIPALIFLYLAPESYRWLLNHGQSEKARHILIALEQNHEIPGTTSSTSIKYIDTLIHHQTRSSSTPSLSSCLSQRQNTSQPTTLHLHPRRRLLLIFTIQTLAIFCGIMTTNFYMSRSLTSGRLTMASRVIISLIPTLDIFFQLPAYFLIQRIGVRTLLIVSAVGMALCFVIAVPVATLRNGSFSKLNLYDLYDSDTTNAELDRAQELNGVVLAFTLLSYFFYDLGVSPIAWLLQSEYTISLTSPNTQDLSAVLPSIASAWRFALELAFMFAQGRGLLIGPSYMLVWLFANLLIAVVVFLFMSETAGRTLEDMDRYFAGGRRWIVARDKEARRVVLLGKGRGGGGSAGEEMGYQLNGEAREMNGRTTKRMEGPDERPPPPAKGPMAREEDEWGRR